MFDNCTCCQTATGGIKSKAAVGPLTKTLIEPMQQILYLKTAQFVRSCRATRARTGVELYCYSQCVTPVKHRESPVKIIT